MKLTYYGTAAAECWPGIFCMCPVCAEARRLGGKNIRTRSQALVNADLLLDLPPDTYMHSLHYGLELGRVRSLFVTHSHSDHWYPEDLEMLRDPFSRTREGILPVYGNAAVREKLLQTIGSEGGEHERYQFHTLTPFQTVLQKAETGEDYAVTPLPALHDRREECLIYHIRQGEKAILYAHDTGYFPEKTMEWLKEKGGFLNLVSLDCTTQSQPDGGNHMGMVDAAREKERLFAAGIADERTVFVVNHFSHNGLWLHEKMQEEAEKYGFLVSYDGMEVQI